VIAEPVSYPDEQVSVKGGEGVRARNPVEIPRAVPQPESWRSSSEISSRKKSPDPLARVALFLIFCKPSPRRSRPSLPVAVVGPEKPQRSGALVLSDGCRDARWWTARVERCLPVVEARRPETFEAATKSWGLGGGFPRLPVVESAPHGPSNFETN
jgi:hypothetical protein